MLKANQNHMETKLLDRLNELSKENINEKEKIEIKSLAYNLSSILI